MSTAGKYPHEYELIPSGILNQHTDNIEYKYNETQALTGGSSEYYKIHITNPTTFHSEYDAECNDIIEALQMNFAEGNIFKAVWRMAASRIGKGKPGNTYLYDAEKIEFFAQRIIKQQSTRKGDI